MKGPPPPVAPKPSWPRQISTVGASTVGATPVPLNDENKPIIVERQASQKFNRSSSMNQISSNNNQQQDIVPPRNKSLSIPDSRLIIFDFFLLFFRNISLNLDFLKVFILMHFVLLVSWVEAILEKLFYRNIIFVVEIIML
jgi:hypothetical protein